MIINGLKERDVTKIREAFWYADGIFRSLEGWPYCTIYQLYIRDSARDGEGSMYGIKVYNKFIAVEFDSDQTTRVGVAGTEKEVNDIVLTFYGTKVPNLGVHICMGMWLEDQELNVTNPERHRFGPLCPKCNGGTGTGWTNPITNVVTCDYCGGLGWDIHDDRMKFYGILRDNDDERIDEHEYTCYHLDKENIQIMSIIDDSRLNNIAGTAVSYGQD
jgi:hypothetical protein